jgi:hypothetical protein
MTGSPGQARPHARPRVRSNCSPDPSALALVMEKDYLTLKRASTSRPSGEWNDDDFEVLAEGVVVGRTPAIAPRSKK